MGEHGRRGPAGSSTYVDRPEAREGGDIGIHGSIELARSLLSAGLVDELRLVVASTLAHTGRKLFDATDEGGMRTLELLDSTRTEAGSLLLAYRVAA